MEKLYETKHDYYCNEGNYYASGMDQPYSEYKSWADFLEEEGEGFDLPEYNGDPNYRNGKLKLYWMGQRKGLYRWTEIEVCRADEPAIREYLKPRWEHLQKLWSGISI